MPTVLTVVVGLLWGCAASSAADRVYWANRCVQWFTPAYCISAGLTGGGAISFAGLNGSGGGDLATDGATVGAPDGVAIDSVARKIYWSNNAANKISFANLDGSGGGDLATGAATVSGPSGVAIDPDARKIYWANPGANTLSYANLDGSGGGDLNTGAATVNTPFGVTVDPAAGRLYWANYGSLCCFSGAISFARLDGLGGGDLATGTATVRNPVAVAVDPSTGKIYWANWGGGISYATLDGTGGGDLATGAASTGSPTGIAVDPATGKIYWARFNDTSPSGISYINTNGSGGADLNTVGATTHWPAFTALLVAPSGIGAPSIGGGSEVGATLSCSRGSWASDVVPAFFYHAPDSFAYQWFRGGAAIAGATTATYDPHVAGAYGCAVTAANQAGSTTQTSAPFAISTTPTATTGGAFAVTATHATLTGTVNPGGRAIAYHFDYGTTAAYGSRAPTRDATVGSDTSDHVVSLAVSNLRPSRTYHFRVVASNAIGSSPGQDRMFKTAPEISAYRLTPTSFVGARHGPSVLSGVKLGTKVQYRLAEPAKITFTVDGVRAGRRQGASCLPDNRRRRKLPRCVRYVLVKGSFTLTGTAGRNSFRFTGRLNNQTLPPGNYRLVVTARDKGGVLAPPVRIPFTIRR